mgnify:FL=1
MTHARFNLDVCLGWCWIRARFAFFIVQRQGAVVPILLLRYYCGLYVHTTHTSLCSIIVIMLLGMVVGFIIRVLEGYPLPMGKFYVFLQKN